MMSVGNPGGIKLIYGAVGGPLLMFLMQGVAQ
jgi:hypothetical protein